MAVTDGKTSESAEVTLLIYRTDYAYCSLEGGGDGSAPHKALSNAYDAYVFASEEDKKALAVSNGTFFVDSGAAESITLVDDVSIYGGFSKDDWSRDPVSKVTIIRDSGTGDGNTIYAPPGITEITILDGLTVIGGSPLEGNTSKAIYVEESLPTISNNIIQGGPSGAGSTYGIEIENSTSFRLSKNVIDGGGGFWTIGVYLKNAANHIIDANEISGGGGGGSSYGISLGPPGGSGTIYNNTIFGGTGYQASFGISCGVAESILNNTIDAGISIGFSIAVYFDADGIYFLNNIVFSLFSGAWGVFETENRDPARFDNNDVFDCGMGLYYDDDQALSLYYVWNGTFASSASGDDPLTTPTGVDNVSVDPVFNEADDDLNLSSGSPSSVTTGGIDGSPAGEDWGFTTDKDGNTRTGNGSTGWSLGAYEYDG